MSKAKLMLVVCCVVLPLLAVGGVAQQRLGWVGPIYVELAESLERGFRAYYLETYGEPIEITFVRPGGWPVCVDQIRLWDGVPDADIFLGAGAPAHRVVADLGLSVPYVHAHWDMIPDEWHGMAVKDPDGIWSAFAPWLVSNMYNDLVLAMYDVPPPETWDDMLDPKYRGMIAQCLTYASGTMHEVVEIILQTRGERDGWAFIRYLGAQVGRWTTGSVDTTHMVTRGEYPIGIAQPQMNAMVARRDGYPVGNLVPDVTILVPEAAALLKGAPNIENAKIFLDWLYSMEGQQYVLEGGYFTARTDISFSAWDAEGVGMASHAMAALDGADNFWDVELDLLEYDLDLASERWDAVGNYFEREIYRKWGELRSTLAQVEAIEGQIGVAKADGVDVADAEAIAEEARLLFEEGELEASREAVERAREALRA